MVNEYFPFCFPGLIALFVLLSFAETALAGTWLPAYFRYAIPLFRREIPLSTPPDLAAKIPELEQKLRRTLWRPAIVFRALGPNEIAFRQKFGNRNPMAGLIRLEPEKGRMNITGNLYWTFLLLPLLPLLFLTFIGGQSIVFLLALTMVVFVLTFGMQRYHYSQIAQVIVETAVTAAPLTEIPIQPLTYEPIVDAYKAPNLQTGLSSTEIILLVVLAALLVIGAAAAFLLFG